MATAWSYFLCFIIGWERVLNSVTQTVVFFFFFSTGNKIMEPQLSGTKTLTFCLHIYEVWTRVERQNSDGSVLNVAFFYLAQTWVKFSSLSGHGGAGVLQLVGCCGACAIHAVGGHVCPVGGGWIILGVLVLAKRRIWGIVLQRVTSVWAGTKNKRGKLRCFTFLERFSLTLESRFYKSSLAFL